MFVRYAFLSLIAAALTTLPSDRAEAGGGDFLGGFAAGAITGAVITNAVKNRRAKKRRARSRGYSSRRYSSRPRSGRSRSSIVRDDANVQRALNLFGYDAGRPDGLFGRRTRAAIVRYQDALGASRTGSLSPAQRAALLAAYAQATSNPGTVNPDPAKGKPSGSGTTSTPIISPPDAMNTFLVNLKRQVPNTGTRDATRNAPKDGLTASLIERLCARPEVNALKKLQSLEGDGSDGRVATQTIAQGYCTARSYSLARLQFLLDGQDDFDPQSSWTQCTGFADAQKDAILNGLGMDPADATASLAQFMAGKSATERATISESFEVCMGMALATGHETVSMRYGALLAAFDEPAYGEIVAGQFGLALGTEQSGPNAAAWYEWTADALDEGAPPLVDVSEDYDHAPLLRALADTASEPKLTAATYVEQLEAGTPTTALSFPDFFGKPSGAETDNPRRNTFAMRKSMTAILEVVLEMTPQEALQHCSGSDSEALLIGLNTCRAIAYATEDYQLAASYDARIRDIQGN
ncbi:MAG: peptidoglycan-binding domain-containing protein [Pseudomonadota bacterium]